MKVGFKMCTKVWIEVTITFYWRIVEEKWQHIIDMFFYYRSTIVGSCKNNSQKNNQKKMEIMDPIKRLNEKLY